MKNKPNVILMFVDDLGYGDVSSFNPDGKIHTKNIDKLAEAGIKFTNFHACSAQCTPSRYGLLTGRYGFRSRLKFSVLPGDSLTLIERDRMTLANVFKNAGYTTACVGKWHLGLEWQLNNSPVPKDFGGDDEWYVDMKKKTAFEPSITPSMSSMVKGLDIDYEKPITYGPNEYGFDYFFGMAASLDQPPYVYIENHEVLDKPTSVSGVIKMDRRGIGTNTTWACGPISDTFNHETALDVFNDKVLDLIDDYSEKDDPFFIYYPTPAVHTPLLPSEKFKGKSGLNAYCDIVLQMDDMVGQIAEKLEEKGILDDTLFVITSDNGCAASSDFEFLLSKGHNPSGHLRGHKFSLYEGGHRVPTVFYYPKMIKESSVCDELICHTDFFKTFAKMLDIDVPDNAAEDSFDVLSVWFENGKTERKSIVSASSSGYLGITKDGYKLACCEKGGDYPKAMLSGRNQEPIEQNFELYNLSSDIGEKDDIIDHNEEIIEILLEELDEVFENGRSTIGERQENFTPEKWVQINWKDKISGGKNDKNINAHICT